MVYNRSDASGLKSPRSRLRNVFTKKANRLHLFMVNRNSNSAENGDENLDMLIVYQFWV